MTFVTIFGDILLYLVLSEGNHQILDRDEILEIIFCFLIDTLEIKFIIIPFGSFIRFLVIIKIVYSRIALSTSRSRKANSATRFEIGLLIKFSIPSTHRLFPPQQIRREY
jgi:hypothetical protein